MMLDTSAYFGQTGIPPQFLLQALLGQSPGQHPLQALLSQGQHPLQALLGQSQGQHPQGFGGGYTPQGFFGQQAPFGQAPTWPTIGGQGPFGGFPPTGNPFGGGFLPPALIAHLGQLAAIAPYLQQLGQQGLHGGWPGQQQLGQFGGFAPQQGAWGQQHPFGALGRGLPYQGIPHMAFTGC